MRRVGSPFRRLTGLVLLIAMVVIGCGDDGGSSNPRGSITVSAAASLRGAFAEIGEAFTDANREVEVLFNFDSSSNLANQILEGAPAHVFASADQESMAQLMYLEAVEPEVEVFARNHMAIVVPPDNPAGISGLDDLANGGVISLCGESVPCGRYAAEVLTNAGVSIEESRVTRGQNATATLTAVTEGDAVAAIVYATDAAAAGESAKVIENPAELDVTASYPIGVVAGTDNKATAEAFVEFVLGDAGQSILASYGFLPRS